MKKNYTILNGDCREEMKRLSPNSVDAIVTDPPYELNFMGKGWDNAGVSFNKETWQKCLRVLKPGGYLLAFGGTRTYHRIACAIEDAGFEIRDCIMWLYGSGFPKSQNLGNAVDKKNGIDNRTGNYLQGMGSNNTESMNNHKYDTQNYKKHYEERKATNKWQGWGTCLKPSYEPIIVARKPFKGSLVDNVMKYGVGGLNIDECRVETNDDLNGGAYRGKNTKIEENATSYYIKSPKLDGKEYKAPTGRFPANTILTYDENDFDEVCCGFPYTKSSGSKRNDEKTNSSMTVPFADHKSGEHYKGSGSAARYFYCVKASNKDRDEGIEDFGKKKTEELQGGRKEGSAGSIMLNKDGSTMVNPYAGSGAPKKNFHPTVKPTELMQYLVRLVAPKGSTILDPFMGSGSTGKAVMYENKERNADYKFIGIEMDAEYCKIAEARIDFVERKKENEQLSLEL